MMKKRIRDLLHETPFHPFIIRMADGTAHRVDHPEFVLASSDAPQVVIEAVNGDTKFPSGAPITSVELVQPADRKP